MSIAAGTHFSLFVDKSGNVWFSHFTYDNGTRMDGAKMIEGVSHITQVSAITDHGLILDTEGNVWGLTAAGL